MTTQLTEEAIASNHRLFEAAPDMARLIERSVGTGVPMAVGNLQGLSLLYFALSAAMRGRRETVLVLPDRETLIQAVDQLECIVRDRGLEEEYDILPFEDYDFQDLGAHLAVEEKRIERAQAIRRVLCGEAHGKRSVICATLAALCRRVLPPERYRSLCIQLNVGGSFKFSALQEACRQLGYAQRPQVKRAGDISVRGGIIDVFSPGEDMPVRLEFFGDDVESIRKFDISSQASKIRLKSWTLTPAYEVAYGGEPDWDAMSDVHAELARRRIYFDEAALYPAALGSTAPFIDSLPPGSLIVADPVAALGELERRVESFKEWAAAKDYADPDALAENIYLTDPEPARKDREVLFLSHFTEQAPGGPEPARAAVKTLPPLPPALDGIADLLRKESRNGLITIISKYKSRLDHFLDDEGIGGVLTYEGNLQGGFALEKDKIYFFTDAEMFHRPRPAEARKPGRERKPIREAAEIAVGDYVVHAEHGVAVYEGVVTQTLSEGVRKDFFSLRYAKGDSLFVPVEQLDRLEKYIGLDGASPRIYPLHSGRWNNIKKRVRKKVEDIAAALYALYRERDSVQGHAYSKDNLFMQELEDSFQFDPTEDQLQTFAEVKTDMESPKPMDRMVYGDVGYGKTEVAIRAAFKATLDKKQAAVLAPTTLLAEQHLKTFEDRFARFPTKIASLSRYKSRKEQKETLAALAAGDVQIVIGTHRLLSADVAFKDLGLLIIDEEQRFGVKHKERIKMLKSSVDTLTLTATPIPRTLNMSLVGLRDTSLIETPPEDRKGVKTFVEEWRAGSIVEAIERELARGGQVYYVHNEIKTLPNVEEFLRRNVPRARVTIVHGRLNEKESETAMTDFLERRYDILLCTTIIENGLDMPNVNTLIVNAAENFGLAQLYQLRGRVGRSYRQSYAWLFYTPMKELNDNARKRLAAIRDFAELGSGYRLAMRDLEIRGAGNLLGKEQSGQIAEVGFTLYCQMLSESVARLKGTKVEEIPPPEVEVALDAFLPEDYITDVAQRTATYKRILAAGAPSTVDELRASTEDRYGDLPEQAANFIELAKTRTLAAGLDIASVKQLKAVQGFDVVFKEEKQARRFRELPFPKAFEMEAEYFADRIRFESAGLAASEAVRQLNLFLELAFKKFVFR